MSGTTTSGANRDHIRDLDHSMPVAKRLALGTALNDAINAIAELQGKYDALVAANVSGATPRTLPTIQPLQGGTRTYRP